jgi:hypothetical protein
MRKFEAEYARAFKVLGVDLSTRNTENIAFFYKDELDMALRGSKYKDWSKEITTKERRKLRRIGLVTMHLFTGHPYLKPRKRWVELVYPEGVPEDQFPDWRIYVDN